MYQDPKFRKLYISNLKNYLHEIDNPTEEDKIRWPIELIQNAKDSLYLSSYGQMNKRVSVTIEIKGNPDNIKEVVFSHDGPPFTNDSYEGLMYKISQGKSNNKKTTGKFGTGFITTHVLSKIVFISGDIIDEYNNITGFSVEMHREGKTDEEIWDNFIKMNNSYKRKSNRLNLTTFKYQTSTIKSKHCAKLGIINLKKHISNILINCPDIKCITLIENGRDIVYSASISNENSMIYTVKSSGQMNDVEKYFLKFEHKPVDITIEIDDKYNIIPKGENVECLYAVFPLIGTGSHILPFSINSPKFEPSTERNNLLLLGEVDEVVANRNFLLSSIDLYISLIDELLNKKCSNIYELARGLKLDKCPYKCFDLAWYDEYFLTPMKNILAKKVMVKSCSNEKVFLSDAYFPSNMKDNIIKQFLNLSAIKKYFPNMINYNDFMVWKDYIWSNPRIVSVNDIIEKIQNDKSLFDEPNFNTFNEILSFLWEYDKNLLHNQAIIPNMKNELKCLSIDGIILKECKKVSDEIIQIIEAIKIPWKSTHVNNKINSIRFDEVDETDAEKKITDEFQKLIKTNNNSDLQISSYCLMRFVLKNDEKREKMFQIASKIDDFPYTTADIIYISKVNPIIWKYADDYVLRKIISNIQNFDSSTIENKLDFIKEFLNVFKIHFKFEPDFVNSIKIIPNAKFEFKCLNDLFNQSTVFHNHFSPKIKEYFNIDMDERIINPEINHIIQSKKSENITDFFSIIDENINVDDFEKFIPIAELVLSVIPEKNQKQKEIFNIYKHFKPSINEILIDDDSFNLKYYDKANKIILSKLCQFVEESDSLQKFQENYSLNEEDAFNSLNLLYSKFEELTYNHSIIPNKEGKFMVKKELKIDPKIDDKIFELFKKLNQNSEIQEDQQLNNLQKIVHPKVKMVGIENFDVFGFCKALNKKIKAVISNPTVDRDILKMINQCMDIDFSNVTGESMSEDQKVRMNILHNAHIAFIKNRIRELSSPKISDYQRWPFELIQNATDCIQDLSEKKHNEELNGHIVFTFNDDEVIFEHYGAPFTHRNLISLLYQYGGEKEGKSKIGRFGTGFLSTMILTRKVIITSDLKKSDDDIKGFTVTIDRSGNTNEELKNYIGLMEESLNTDLEKTGMTRFVFKLPENNEGNKNCYKAYNDGLKSLNQYIAPSLIFNPKIKSITLKTKTTHYYYTFEKNDDDEEDEDEESYHIKEIKVLNKMNNRYKYRQFIYYNSKKHFNDKSIKVECLLEIGSKRRNIIANEEFLFLQFPMFGMKEFKSPIIINSPDFEPETERNNIIVNSKQLKEIPTNVDESKEEIEKDDTDDKFTSVNKFIISESVCLFKSILKFVRNYGCEDLFYICYGLKRDSLNQFYQKNFIEMMRQAILKSDLFEYSPGVYKKCKFVIIPYLKYATFSKKEGIDYEDEKKFYETYYNLVSQLNYGSKSLMDYSLSLKWLSLLWPDFEYKFDIEQFLGYISQYENVDELPFKNIDSISKKELFFSELIQFILQLKKRDHSFSFGKNNIFINKNKKLVPFNEIALFNWGYEAKKVIFDWMDNVNYIYQNKMLSDGLKHLYNMIKFNEFPISSGIHAIEDRINEDNSIYFMKYVLQGDEKRELMHKFSKKLLNIPLKRVEISMNAFNSKNPENNMDKIINNMFRTADDFIIDKLITKIQDIDVRTNIDFLYDFVKLCKEIVSSTKFEKYKIIPNKSFKLFNYRELSKDNLENETLKQILNKLLNLDLNEELVHEKFTDFVDNKMNLNDASNKIVESINKQGDDFYKKDKHELYKIVIQHSIKEDYKTTLIKVFKFFYKNKDDSFDSENEQFFSFNLTKKIIELILDDISKCISLFDNIKEFAYYFNKCSIIYEIFRFDISQKKFTETNLKSIYNNLSDAYYLLLKYNLLKEREYKVFPNDCNGDLHYFEDIKIVYDFHVESNLLFELWRFLIAFSCPNEIQIILLNRDIPINEDFEKMIKEHIIDLNWFVINISEKFPEQDKQAKKDKLVTYFPEQDEFVRFLLSHAKLKVAFAELIDRLKKDIPPGILENETMLNYLINDPLILKFMKELYEDCMEEQIPMPPPSQISKSPRPIIFKPNSKPSTPIPFSYTEIKRLLHLKPIDYIRKYKKQAILYEKLKKNPKYSNINWPVKSEFKTDISFNYKDKTYYINQNCDKSDEFDISACYKDEIIYFKVQYYYPYFMNVEKKDGKNIVSSYINDTNDEIIYLSNLD